MKKNKYTKQASFPLEVLKMRAAQLARQTTASDDSSDLIQIATFNLANEIYGIELSYIRIIFPLKYITYIPGTPSFISGIVNVRGEIISIVDLKILFDLPQSDQNKYRQVIVLSSADIEFGIQVDRVIDVRQISEENIQSSLTTLTGIRSDYLKGVTGDGMVIIDGEKILHDKKMIIHITDS